MSECSLSSFTFPLSGSSASESLESSSKKNACKIGCMFKHDLLVWFWQIFLPALIYLWALFPLNHSTYYSRWKDVCWQKLRTTWSYAYSSFSCLMFTLQDIPNITVAFCIFFPTEPIGIFDFYFPSLFYVTPINQKMPLREAFFFHKDCTIFDWKKLMWSSCVLITWNHDAEGFWLGASVESCSNWRN